MPKSYADLQAEITRLQREAESVRAAELAAVVDDIRAKMKAYGITAADLSERKAKRKPVKPKYRNPASGETWSGRGRTPRWLAAAEAAGKSREKFAIKDGKP